ncbi:MAG TPA: dihydrodipicolinate reductase C-terminal domain-containing protein [Longimicrobiales bacterium]|nr:dihydrodipicolinate reductase C-terminal domain-containing protein [Longimicrobiales bacterium]
MTEGSPRIAIVGLGRMGREVADVARERGLAVVARLDQEEIADRVGALDALRAADVAIEFTTPEAAVANIDLCLEASCPVVVGTTGWYDELDAVRARVLDQGGALLHAPNFSVGVALVKALCERAGELLAGLEGFDVHLTETHHAEKKDAPSGTAFLLKAALDRAGHDVPITSIRIGFVPGRHEVCIDGSYEQVIVSHDARSRRVFADGALRAALWLRGRSGVFTMDDVLNLERA